MDTYTVMDAKKELYSIKGLWQNKFKITGYEIHMGKTEIRNGLHPPYKINALIS